jgi:hypothetical protein
MDARRVIPARRLDDIASLPRDPNHDYWQLHGGPTRLDVALRRVRGVGIHYERVGTRLRARGVTPPDYLALSLALPGARTVRCNGIDARGQVAVLGSNRQMDCVVDHAALLNLVLNRATIERLFPNEEGAEALRARCPDRVPRPVRLDSDPVHSYGSTQPRSPGSARRRAGDDRHGGGLSPRLLAPVALRGLLPADVSRDALRNARAQAPGIGVGPGEGAPGRDSSEALRARIIG